MTNTSYFSLRFSLFSSCIKFICALEVVGDTAVFFQCNSNVLLVFGKTDKMLLVSYVCTEKKPQTRRSRKKSTVDDGQKLETGRFEPQWHGCKQHYSSKWNQDEIQNHTQQEVLQLLFVFSNLYLYISRMN